MYYLKSRYYDPGICRFINADDAAMLGVDGEYVSYNLFVYCGGNPVKNTDAYGYSPTFVPFIFGISEREKAQEKYNSSTVNVYMAGDGEPINGMVNVYFYHLSGDETRTNIKIADSHLITNPFEQEAILKVITESPYYSFEQFGSIDYMQAQWVAHNTVYSISTSGKLGEKLITSILQGDPVRSSRVLDIRSLNNVTEGSNFVYKALQFFIPMFK